MDIAVDLAALLLGLASIVGLAAGIAAYRRSRRPRPALPVNCGDCWFMVPKAKFLHRETLEDPDGVVRYICSKRFIEVTPISPWCSLGKSKTRTTTEPE